MGLSRKSIGGAVELREAPTGVRASMMITGRKSIGGAVELRAKDEPDRRVGARRVARASEVLWSSETRPYRPQQASAGRSQEHRRCCGAPRIMLVALYASSGACRKSIGGAVELRDQAARQLDRALHGRKSIGGAVELRVVPTASEVSTVAVSQEHRRCCGAPRSSRSRRRPMRFRSQEHRRCCGAPRKRRPQEGNRLTPSQEHRGCCGASRRTMHADLHAHRFVARASGLPWGFEWKPAIGQRGRR